MPLKVILSVQAQKFLDWMKDKNERQYDFLVQHLRSLPQDYSSDPLLKGAAYQGMRRHRVGDYRVIYRVIHDQIMIYVVEIGHRRDIYGQ